MLIVIWISFFILILHGSDNVPKSLCNFALLPVEIQNHIASYVQFANMVYEADGFLMDRARASDGMLQEAQISDMQSIKIETGDLEVITRSIPIKKQKIVAALNHEKSVLDSTPAFMLLDEKIDIRIIVKCFALSPSYKYLAAWTETDNIEYGIFGAAHKIERFKFDAVTKKFHKLNKYSFANNEIDLIAISDTGQLAIKSKSGMLSFLQYKDEKITSRKIDPLGLIDDSSNIINLLFNKQGTRLAIRYCMSKTFNKLVKKWFSRNYYKFDEISEVFDMNYLSQALLKNLSSKFGSTSSGTRIKFLKDIDESCHVVIIPVEQEESWTLTKYFKLRGVCKNLDMQCGL